MTMTSTYTDKCDIIQAALRYVLRITRLRPQSIGGQAIYWLMYTGMKLVIMFSLSPAFSSTLPESTLINVQLEAIEKINISVDK